MPVSRPTSKSRGAYEGKKALNPKHEILNEEEEKRGTGAFYRHAFCTLARNSITFSIPGVVAE